MTPSACPTSSGPGAVVAGSGPVVAAVGTAAVRTSASAATAAARTVSGRVEDTTAPLAQDGRGPLGRGPREAYMRLGGPTGRSAGSCCASTTTLARRPPEGGQENGTVSTSRPGFDRLTALGLATGQRVVERV